MRFGVFTLFSLFLFLLPIEVECDLQFSAHFPAQLKREILSDFTFLDSIQGSQSTRLHQEIFGDGPLDGRRYTQFLRAFVQSFTYSNSDSPYQIQTDGQRNLYIFSSYLHFARNVSQFSRAINFMHEAYHNSGSFHHIKCPTPFRGRDGKEIVTTVGKIPLSGLFACDDQVRGSYAIEIVMAKNIERFCDNCSASLRREAGLYADDLMQRIVGEDVRRELLQDLYVTPLQVGANPMVDSTSAIAQ